MAILSANLYMSHRPPLGRRDLLAGLADTFYQGALVWFETAAEGGITPVIAAGTEFAGVVIIPSDGATTADTTRVAISTRGSWLFPTVEANPEDFYGQTLYGDVSAASDNPADVLIAADTDTGDIAIGHADEYVSATAYWANIDNRSVPHVATS